jgi:4-diphosphocytidyl-2C-methyl-D-erythritol kinase
LPSGPENGNWNPLHPEAWVRNDLAAVAFGKFPELAEMLSRLGDLGARAQGLSGSGPTIFGIFSNREAALEAGRALRASCSGWLAVVQGLTGAETDQTWEHRVWMI